MTGDAPCQTSSVSCDDSTRPCRLGSRFSTRIPAAARQSVHSARPGRRLTAHQLRTLQERRGFIRRMLRGVYVVAQSPTAGPCAHRRSGLAVPHRCVVTDWTACWLQTGLMRPGRTTRAPHLGLPSASAHAARNNGLSDGGARTFKPATSCASDGINVTTPLRTALDLGRLVLSRIARSAAWMPCSGMVASRTRSSSAEVERFKGMRGVIQLRSLAPARRRTIRVAWRVTFDMRWLDLQSLPDRPSRRCRSWPAASRSTALTSVCPSFATAVSTTASSSTRERGTDQVRREDLDIRFGWQVDCVRKENRLGPCEDVGMILKRGIGVHGGRSGVRRTSSDRNYTRLGEGAPATTRASAAMARNYARLSGRLARKYARLSGRRGRCGGSRGEHGGSRRRRTRRGGRGRG